MCLSGSLSQLGGWSWYRDSVQVGCGPVAHTNHGVIMATAVSPPVGWTAPFVTQQSRKFGTLAVVTQAWEIQLREHHLKRLIKLGPFGNEGRQRPGRPKRGAGRCHRDTWWGASLWVGMWTTSYRVIDCLWSSYQPVIDGPLSRGWNISAGFALLLRIMMFAWASHMIESAKERECEGKKEAVRVKRDDQGAREEVAASSNGAFLGCTWQVNSMASTRVSSGVKTEPRGREGPNEHYGSFITNQRNREAAMNISAFCSSSGITLYLCRPHR